MTVNVNPMTRFYASDMKQEIPVKHGFGTNDIIWQIQLDFIEAIIALGEAIGDDEARALCEANGVVLDGWLASSKVKGVISRVPYPVYVKVYDSHVTGNTKYESPHLGAFQIFRYDYTGRLIKDNSDEFLRTLFPGEKLHKLDEHFKSLLFGYHSCELPDWTWRDHTGKAVNNQVFGIEPEIIMKPEAVVYINDVPLNKMGRIITMLKQWADNDAMLTLDCTVDCEFYLRPYGALNGFRDNYMLLCKLFYIGDECGTHVHVSQIDESGECLKWQDESKLLKAAKELFENMEYTYTDENGKKRTVKKGFMGYMNEQPEMVKDMFGRIWGRWCGCYVGHDDHSSGINVTNNHIEVRIARYRNEAQMIKVIEIVRAIATAIDKMYDAGDDAKKKKAAYKSLKTVWDKAMKKELASDTNSKKKVGYRRRNID